MKKYLKFVLLIIVLGAIYGYYSYNKPHKNLAKITADYKLDAKELFTAYELNEEKSDQLYMGRVIEVSGTIKSIDKNGQTSINLDIGSDLNRVSCEMEPESFADLDKTIKKGDQVTIRGNCAGMLMDVVLQRCVIIKS
jgi:hypothetical protein